VGCRGHTRKSRSCWIHGVRWLRRKGDHIIRWRKRIVVIVRRIRCRSVCLRYINRRGFGWGCRCLTSHRVERCRASCLDRSYRCCHIVASRPARQADHNVTRGCGAGPHICLRARRTRALCLGAPCDARLQTLVGTGPLPGHSTL
jgi:hypothetical protein